jgi:hypothetical protein
MGASLGHGWRRPYHLSLFGRLVRQLCRGRRESGGLAASCSLWTLFVIGAVLFATGIGWPWLKALSSVGFQQTAVEIAGSPVAWFVVVMAISVLSLLPRPSPRPQSNSGGDKGLGAGPNALPNAIRIVFRREPEFLPETAYPNGPVRRSIKIVLKNGGNGWLSKCLLEVISVAPTPTTENCEVLKAFEPAAVEIWSDGRRVIRLAAEDIHPVTGRGDVPATADQPVPQG